MAAAHGVAAGESFGGTDAIGIPRRWTLLWGWYTDYGVGTRTKETEGTTIDAGNCGVSFACLFPFATSRHRVLIVSPTRTIATLEHGCHANELNRKLWGLFKSPFDPGKPYRPVPWHSGCYNTAIAQRYLLSYEVPHLVDNS